MRQLFLFVLVLVLLCAGSAPAEMFNRIGIFSTPEPPDLGCLLVPAAVSPHTRLIAPTPGLYDVHVLCINPRNDHTGDLIDVLGGYEFNVVLPDGWFISQVTLPPNVMDFQWLPYSFFCAGQVPVDRSDPVVTVVLATVTLGTFTDPPPAGYLYMAPYFAAPSMPGVMALTDAEDGFSLSAVLPSRLDFAEAVLAINHVVVPTENRSWGDVKALYR